MGFRCGLCKGRHMPDETGWEDRWFCSACVGEIDGLAEERDGPKLQPASVVRLKPGDVVVVETPLMLSVAEIEKGKENIQHYFPDNEIMIIGGGAALKVVSSEGAGGEEK